ncbi:hypothetical protein J5N97_018523 [Dioscorea zingiberensis]|uniref:DAGKc domain-containing protein n=1 Tax=Dioscorea zingiberensis TaxID=325984 RepID=A0A9D5HBK3_9LILI|nr:hypothetical protein J5N97_018523 [Dioscorea zingiberensis]
MLKAMNHSLQHRRMKDKDTDGVAASALEGKGEVEEVEPETPLVVFVNSRSGGRHGAELKEFPGETCSHSLRPPPDQGGYPPLPFIDWG